MTSILIYGDPQGEHLRADISTEEVRLVSHELRLATGNGLSNFYDRHLCDLPREKCLEIMRALQ